MPSRIFLLMLLSLMLPPLQAATTGAVVDGVGPRVAALLASPFDGLAVKPQRGASARCPAPPEPYVEALAFRSKYEGSDRARDTLNTDAEADYKQATRPMQELEAGISELSDRYVRGQSGAAACALDWMYSWARADALLGEANMTGKAVRKWTLAAVAFNFLKIQGAPGLDSARLHEVREWMTRVAHVVIDEHEQIPPEKINNHYYWAAAAVGAAGIAAQQRELLDWATDAYRISVRDIDRDGVLPREMARRSRALSYHVFALQPLVMLAEMGRINGIDLYAEQDCAICRLINRVTDGLRDPSFFEKRSGARQVVEQKPDGRAMVWVAVLARACPGDERLMLLKTRYQPFSGRRLGGNLTDVYEHISKEMPNAVKSKACSHLWR
jgi:poly(beta-D-mannuronate) lyase